MTLEGLKKQFFSCLELNFICGGFLHLLQKQIFFKKVEKLSYESTIPVIHFSSHFCIYITQKSYAGLVQISELYNRLNLNLVIMSINTIMAAGPTDAVCYGSFDFTTTIVVIVVSCVLGIAWAIFNFLQVKAINVINNDGEASRQLVNEVTEEQRKLLIELGDKIANGAVEFLKQEYLICLIFVVVMFFVIALLTEQAWMTAFAFAIGAVISIVCGAVGMVIATQTNFRTTYCAREGLAPAFRVAFRAGCAMGFALVSLGLLVLTLLILIYKSINNAGEFEIFDILNPANNGVNYKKLFEAIAGYGLGGSFVALFGRVGGGIYTKAADVGADLVGKVEKNLPEDSPKNPATIADNVGDNVGDVAGMSADLFGSFAESTCAALVISSDTLFPSIVGCNQPLSILFYPLLLIAIGIIVCILVSTLSTHIMKVETKNKIESTLKVQLVGSTIILLGVTYVVTIFSFPETSIFIAQTGAKNFDRWVPYICSILGLISGMIIAAFTEYVTSHAYSPVRGLAQTCKAGAASNVTLGLALGYFSTFIPAIFIAVTAFVANDQLGYYGVALSALGMLSNLPLSLAIDGYGPISDNAGGIAEMAEMGEEVRDRTDALDAAGNTTAAIGKGFAIGSAALVSLSLFGGFLHNSHLDLDTQAKNIALTKPEIFAGLLLGAMLPYVFSAFTIRSVGKAAFGMVEEVRRQIHNDPGILAGTSEPDYKACIRISTISSLREMIAPGCLVIFSPLLLGFAFGPRILAGFLPGAIVSGVQLAISAANTGGAWDNAKKYIESGAMQDDAGNVVRKGSEIHKAAVVGDTVGDPLKDTSGPALNILIKLMAIISLVFGSKFESIHPNPS